MSRDVEKDSSPNPEIEGLLHRCGPDPRTISTSSLGMDVKEREIVEEDCCRVHRRLIQDATTTASTRSSRQDLSTESSRANPTVDPSNRCGTTASTGSSIVLNDVAGHQLQDDNEDDEPPPYTAIAPPNHVGWTFDFASSIPYSVCTTPFCRAEAPLAPFQTSLASSTAYHPEGAIGQRQSIAVPLAPPYRLFKFGSHGSLFIHRASPVDENRSTTKCSFGKRRKYGAILVAGAVIIFLMLLSLMVRFVVQRSFWRT